MQIEGQSRFRLPRRWLQFRLRTLWILVTLLAVVVGLLGRDLHRHYRRTASLELVRELQGTVVRSESGGVDRIYLSGEQITDQTLASLVSPLRYVTELRELDLVFTGVSDEGLLLLSELRQLQVVFVHESAISEEGVERLRDLAPHLVVRREMPDPIATRLAMRAIYRHAITAVAWSPHENWFATGSGDGTLNVWAADGHLLRTVAAHEKWLFSVAVDPTGKLLATSGGDHCIRLWDARSLDLLAELQGHTDDVHAVAIAPDCQTLVSAGDDATVRIWDIPSRRTRHILTGHSGPIPALRMIADGSIIASASRDDTVRLWDVRNGSLLRVLAGHDDDVSALAFVHSDEQLVSASYDGTLRWWDVRTGNCITAFYCGPHRVYSLAVDTTRNTILYGDADQLLHGMNASALNGSRIWHQGSIFSQLAYSPSDRWLVGTTAQGTISIFDAQTGRMDSSVRPRYAEQPRAGKVSLVARTNHAF